MNGLLSLPLPRHRLALLVALVLAFALSACSTRPIQPEEPESEKQSMPAPAPKPKAKAKAAPRMVPAPQGNGYYLDDGPHKMVPADLDYVPDAKPRIEALYRPSLRPYKVMGQRFVPMTRMEPYRERGHASWYGKKFHGRLTAIGEVYDMYAMTAAHPTLPLPSYVRVTNVANGVAVIVRVNDRGPFLRGRLIDLSYAAAHRLGYINAGSALVDVELLTHEDIRAAARSSPEPVLAAAPAQVEPAPATPPVPPVASSATVTSPGEIAPYLQLGAFATPANAAKLMVRVREELDVVMDRMHLLDEGGRYRLQIGPFGTRDEAYSLASRIVMLLDLQPHLVMR